MTFPVALTTQIKYALEYEYKKDHVAKGTLKIDLMTNTYTIKIVSKSKRVTHKDYKKAKRKLVKMAEKIAKNTIKNNQI